MSRGRPAHYVCLPQKEQAELESLVRQRTGPQRDVLRARIALMANQGTDTCPMSRPLPHQRQLHLPI